MLARWLLRECRVLLLDEPTRGVDVGAKAEIYRLITDLAKAGIGVLVVSSELEELMGLCTRILSCARASSSPRSTGSSATEVELLSHAVAPTDTESSWRRSDDHCPRGPGRAAPRSGGPGKRSISRSTRSSAWSSCC